MTKEDNMEKRLQERALELFYKAECLVLVMKGDNEVLINEFYNKLSKILQEIRGDS